MIARFWEAAPEHPAAEYENRFVNRRGERKVVVWRSAPLPDEDGQTTGIIAGGIDVTARTEEAEARERERDFLNAIANEAPSLLCLIDEDGVLATMGANKAFERTLEVEAHEAGGTVLWEHYVAPEEAAEVRSLIGRIAAGEVVGDHDNTWVAKSGRRIAVSWSCIRLPSIDERRLLLVSGVDVSERKEREVQLQRERDITSTLMQAIPSIVVVVDQDGIIVDSGVDENRAGVNDAFRAALGWPDEQLVRTSVLDLIDPADGHLARMAIASAANGVASVERESLWRKADDSRIAIAWTATPVADVTLREESLVLLTGVDITERKRHDGGDSRVARAHRRGRRQRAPPRSSANLHDGAQQRLVALSVLAPARRVEARRGDAEAATSSSQARDRARAGARGAARARARHPPGDPHRPGPRARARGARRTDAGPGDARRARTSGFPPPVEAAAYYVVAEALTNVAKYARLRLRVGRRSAARRRARRPSRSPTTASAAPTPRPEPACAGSPTASRLSTARSPSRARTGRRNHGRAPRSRSMARPALLP